MSLLSMSSILLLTENNCVLQMRVTLPDLSDDLDEQSRDDDENDRLAVSRVLSVFGPQVKPTYTAHTGSECSKEEARENVVGGSSIDTLDADDSNRLYATRFVAVVKRIVLPNCFWDIDESYNPIFTLYAYLFTVILQNESDGVRDMAVWGTLTDGHNFYFAKAVCDSKGAVEFQHSKFCEFTCPYLGGEDEALKDSVAPGKDLSTVLNFFVSALHPDLTRAPTLKEVSDRFDLVNHQCASFKRRFTQLFSSSLVNKKNEKNEKNKRHDKNKGK